MTKLTLSVLVLGSLVAQSHTPIPLTDDPDHQGQPSWCQNYDEDGGAAHNCTCKAMSVMECGPDEPKGGGESSKCKVYCRKSACRCRSACTSHLPHKTMVLQACGRATGRNASPVGTQIGTPTPR